MNYLRKNWLAVLPLMALIAGLSVSCDGWDDTEYYDGNAPLADSRLDGMFWYKTVGIGGGSYSFNKTVSVFYSHESNHYVSTETSNTSYYIFWEVKDVTGEGGLYRESHSFRTKNYTEVKDMSWSDWKHYYFETDSKGDVYLWFEDFPTLKYKKISK